MKPMRRMGVSLLLIGLSLISPGIASPLGSTQLQPFTAEYQLKRGKMIIGKVTTSLQLSADGSYIYKSVTVPVGIVAAFSKDEISEISQGQINGNRVIPTRYFYHHKRKKRPKLKKLTFDWSLNRVLAHGTKPLWSSEVDPGTQDKASKILTMMLAMPNFTGEMDIQVVDKTKLKTYHITQARHEQVNVVGNDFETVKLSEAKTGKPVSTWFWLSPELNYLPVKIERKEKKDTFTMTLSRYNLD